MPPGWRTRIDETSTPAERRPAGFRRLPYASAFAGFRASISSTTAGGRTSDHRVMRGIASTSRPTAATVAARRDILLRARRWPHGTTTPKPRAGSSTEPSSCFPAGHSRGPATLRLSGSSDLLAAPLPPEIRTASGARHRWLSRSSTRFSRCGRRKPRALLRCVRRARRVPLAMLANPARGDPLV